MLPVEKSRAMPWSAVLAVGALLASLAVGVIVHEYLHLIVLRRAGVNCSLAFASGRDWRGFRALAAGHLASVELESVPETCSARRLRLAGVAPLAMVPVAGGYVALVQSGLAADTLVGSVVLVGWLACALPSPADFAIVWQPEGTIRQLPGSNATESVE